jgi:UDP-glucose 4-epimerase
MKPTILVTGGAGYIGSHTTLSLLQAGYHVVVLDNLSNSSHESLHRVSNLAGRKPIFIKGDIRNDGLVSEILINFNIEAVLHFAGLKSVGESVCEPLKYYDNNVHGTQVLLNAMSSAKVYSFVFSSSATVYGNQIQMPISESCDLATPTNPYGRSKLMVEDMLRDLAASNSNWRIAILRYFNPAGAHESGLIGEHPFGIPNNLLPFIAQVASGKLSELTIFGDDYLTHDGTGVRDYIHVVDLAEGHLKALEILQTKSGTNVWNLGTGRGYSVFEVVKAFELASGRKVPYRIAPRRKGDIATSYANPSKAELELGWKAQRDLNSMMQDAWRWQCLNPNGFEFSREFD